MSFLLGLLLIRIKEIIPRQPSFYPSLCQKAMPEGVESIRKSLVIKQVKNTNILNKCLDSLIIKVVILDVHEGRT